MQKKYGKFTSSVELGKSFKPILICHMSRKTKRSLIDYSLNFIGGFEYDPDNYVKVIKDLDTKDINFMDAVKASVQLVKLL